MLSNKFFILPENWVIGIGIIIIINIIIIIIII